jgi:hypothetical protein
MPPQHLEHHWSLRILQLAARPTATCKTAGNTTWLQVTDVAGASDRRPAVQGTDPVTFGLHRYDVNLAPGNLVQDVLAQETAYRPRH